jgi:hypothetical protein
LPGGPAGAKWCHFAFDTVDAPSGLHRLSEAAGIPKERAVLSFLLAGPTVPAPEPASTGALPVRLFSDAFPVAGGGTGRYGCSARGLALVKSKRGEAAGLESGALELFTIPQPERRDEKSGALALEYRAPPT